MVVVGDGLKTSGGDNNIASQAKKNVRVELDSLVGARAHLVLAGILAEPEKDVALDRAVPHLCVQEDVRVPCPWGKRQRRSRKKNRGVSNLVSTKVTSSNNYAHGIAESTYGG